MTSWSGVRRGSCLPTRPGRGVRKRSSTASGRLSRPVTNNKTTKLSLLALIFAFYSYTLISAPLPHRTSLGYASFLIEVETISTRDEDKNRTGLMLDFVALSNKNNDVFVAGRRGASGAACSLVFGGCLRGLTTGLSILTNIVICRLLEFSVKKKTNSLRRTAQRVQLTTPHDNST